MSTFALTTNGGRVDLDLVEAVEKPSRYENTELGWRLPVRTISGHTEWIGPFDDEGQVQAFIDRRFPTVDLIDPADREIEIKNEDEVARRGLANGVQYGPQAPHTVRYQWDPVHRVPAMPTIVSHPDGCGPIGCPLAPILERTHAAGGTAAVTGEYTAMLGSNGWYMVRD